jgi:uncharacterized protein with ATP-grasp and redox domains
MGLAEFAETIDEKYSYIQECLQELVKLDRAKGAMYFYSVIAKLAHQHLGVSDPFADEKLFFNQKLLELEPDLENILDKYPDRLFAAMKLSLAGNIMDPSLVENLNMELVKKLIKQTLAWTFDEKLYAQLRAELSNSRELLYLGDNAGEIVLDKIFIKELIRNYPDLHVTFAVRGGPVVNDATIEDACLVGLDKYTTIINNGTSIPGTDLDEVSPAFFKSFRQADIIIAKGCGNYCSLSGCKANVYYLLLSKCSVLQKKFNLAFAQQIFVHDHLLKEEQYTF